MAKRWCRQATAAWLVPRNSHPPLTVAARPAIPKMVASTGARRGPLGAFGAKITGAAAGVCLAA
jgi:hypothetical protein